MTDTFKALTDSESQGIQHFEKPAPGTWTEAYGLGKGMVSLRDCFDPEFYELEKEAVFKRSWLHMGRVEQCARPGNYFVKELKFLGVSVIVVKGMDDKIRAFHNVCSHRGNKLVWDEHPQKESSGMCRQFACKYHGWRFDLQGEINYVHNAPEFFDLSVEALHLPEIECDVWAGFIFINLEKEPRQSLQEFLGPELMKLESYPFHKLTQKYVLESDIAANWKLYMDAFQELYHVPFVHGLMNNPAVPATGIDKVPFMVPASTACTRRAVRRRTATCAVRGRSTACSAVRSTDRSIRPTSGPSATVSTPAGSRTGASTTGCCTPTSRSRPGVSTGTPPTSIGHSARMPTASRCRCSSCRRRTRSSGSRRNTPRCRCASSCCRTSARARRCRTR